MAEIIVIGIAGLIMCEIYSRTKRPKLYALLNTAAGAGSLLLWQFLSGGTVCINNFNSAVSGILGIPGVILCALLGTGG